MVSRPFGIQVYEGEGTQREGESKCAFDKWRFRKSLEMECDRSREGLAPVGPTERMPLGATSPFVHLGVCVIFFIIINICIPQRLPTTYSSLHHYLNTRIGAQAIAE